MLSRKAVLNQCRLLYFTLNVLVCALHSFKTKFLIEVLKLTRAQVGFAYTFQAIMFVGSIFWSILADSRVGLHRTISIAASIGYALTTCFLLLKNVSPIFMNFWWVAAVLLCSYFMSSALFPLLDAQVLYQLDQLDKDKDEDIKKSAPKASDLVDEKSLNEKPSEPSASVGTRKQANGKKSFGKLRLWGAVGVSVASWLSLAFIHFFNDKQGMFGVLILAAILYSIFVFIFLPRNTEIHMRAHQTDDQHPVLKLLKIPMFLSFLLFILSAGIVRAVINIYLSYAVDVVMALGEFGPPFLSVIRLISEVLIFFFGKEFTECFGYHGVLLLSQGAGIIRTLGYGFLTGSAVSGMPKLAAYAIISLLELLKGVNSSLIVVGATKLASDMAPPGCEHTAQGLLTGIFIGLGSAVGGLFSGLFLRFIIKDDICAMFRWAGWISLAIYIVFFTHFYFSGALNLRKPSFTVIN
jgi:hypothetical protein